MNEAHGRSRRRLERRLVRRRASCGHEPAGVKPCAGRLRFALRGALETGTLVLWPLSLALPSGSVAAAVAEDRPVVCATCHEEEAAAFERSVHVGKDVDCHSCHEGAKAYDVEPAEVERLRRLARRAARAEGRDQTKSFDHGAVFSGRPSRKDIPDRCGSCHSDVERMNPYGLATDQLAQYRTSGHGRALFVRDDDRVAVCIDCHGVHDILPPTDPASKVNPKNVPATCGACHSDPKRMEGSQLSTLVVEQYRESVHGQGLLERGDVAMPNCATCHGSHSAVPPGFSDVGHVCGRCHQQEERYFLESHHARFSLYPRCVGCHASSAVRHDHRIIRVVASPESIKATYEKLVRTMPGAAHDPAKMQDALAARRDPPIKPFETICQRCHNPSQQEGHRVFFTDLTKQVQEMEGELYGIIRQAEFRYAETAARVDRVGQSVLLVPDEAFMVEEMRTKLVGMGPLQHTLDAERLGTAADQLNALADEVDRSLDKKIRGLRRRHLALVPMWGFIAVFVTALWIKYKRLKAAWVTPLAE